MLVPRTALATQGTVVMLLAAVWITESRRIGGIRQAQEDDAIGLDAGKRVVYPGRGALSDDLREMTIFGRRLFVGPVEVGELENREVDPGVVEVARQLRGELRLVGCGNADPSRLNSWARGHERIVAGTLDPSVYNQRVAKSDVLARSTCAGTSGECTISLEERPVYQSVKRASPKPPERIVADPWKCLPPEPGR